MRKSHAISGILLALALAGCGGGGSSSTSAAAPSNGAVLADENVIGKNGSVTINKAGTYAVNVVGDGNTVNITGGNITKLTIAGSSNTVTVGPAVTLAAVVFSGNINTVNVPTAYAGSVSDIGLSNSLKRY